METWTQNNKGSWKRWSHPGPGLDAIASASSRMVSILVVGIGPEDDEQLLAAVRLARRLASGPLEVVAGIVHPSARWVESVRKAGADIALLVPQPKPFELCKTPPLYDVVELGRGICPELHAERAQGTTLSVCGRRKDLMVLARHHFDRWCFSNKEHCPHRLGEPHA